jgi:UDP-2-acetamido-2-deoxy-ribo-hexuluronate aminotransferase
MMEFIDLRQQYRRNKARIDARIQFVLEHGRFIMGPEVAELETRLADYAGVPHAVTCANGTDALQLSLMAAGVGPGDYVITTPFTFFATVEAIMMLGAVPLFSDVDPNSFNLCPERLEDTIRIQRTQLGSQLKAVIAVDIFGLPADYEAIEGVCNRAGLFLIEDAAQSFGAAQGQRRAGSFGDIATTSFFPAKPLGCYGDGGAVFTHSRELAETLRSLRVHGQGENKYRNVRVGMNSRLDSIQAAILLEKLAIFDAELEARQTVAKRYREQLPDGLQCQQVADGMQSAYAQFSVRARDGSRDQYVARLQSSRIPVQIYYPVPLHLQPALSQCGFTPGQFPVSEAIAEDVFSLPMHPYLDENSQHQIIAALQ